MTETFAREELGLLSEASLDAVFIIDRTTEKVVSANLAADDLLRREVGGLVGLTLAELSYEPRDLRDPGHYEDVALRGGDDYPVYVELLGSPRDSGGASLIAYTARDLSTRRSLERELAAKHAALITAHVELEACRQEIARLRSENPMKTLRILTIDDDAARPSAEQPAWAHRLMRQATLGALTTNLLHDLASMMQAMNAALSEINVHGGEHPEIRDAVVDANAAGEEAVQLFVQMRKFIRDGEVKIKPIQVSRMVERAVKLAGGYVRERAQLQVAELPRAEIAVAESLFLQVLVNLLRNAADASPAGGAGLVDIQVEVGAHDVLVRITDDGPGVPDIIAATMFEPFTDSASEGVGLTIAAHVMQLLGGTIGYRKHPTRGACFSVTIPRA
ncbi:MAG TPA: sensor histidine kinase [Kofleriaceae bacterium]